MGREEGRPLTSDMFYIQADPGETAGARDQEGRRGSDEVVPGTSVLPLSETGKSGNFSGCIKGAKYRFALHLILFLLTV